MQNKTPLSQVTKLVIAIAFVLFSAYNVVLTALQDYILFLSGDISALGTSFGIFMVASVVSRFVSGWILERVDDALGLVFGNLVLTLVFGSYPLFSSIILIYIIRAVQGFGWALTTVTVLTMIVENTQSSKVSQALGYLNGFGSFSLMIFPVFGSWIVNIKSIETFNFCFLSALGLSAVAFGLSVYVWRATPSVISHKEPVSGLPDRTVLTPTFSAILLFMAHGVVLSYSPELATLNDIQNPGLFFSIFAFAQIIGSALGGIYTGISQYRQVATIGAFFVVGGVLILGTSAGILGYIISAIATGFGLVIGNIALNSYVSSVANKSAAKGMAVYSAGIDTAIAIGSFGTAFLLGLGWGFPAILSLFAFTALVSSVYSFFAIKPVN